MGGKSPKKILPSDKYSAKANDTADVVNEFMKEAYEILNKESINKKRKKPANFLLIRGPGSFKTVETFEKRFGLKSCSVSNSGIVQGVSRYLGIDVIPAGDYSDVEKDLRKKTAIAVNALDKYDFVMMHINGADTFSHDKDQKGKVRFIEKIDNEVFSEVIKLRHVNIAVISDHETSSRSGEHSFGPVPFLIYNGEESDGIDKFDENHCKKGFRAANPMMKIMQECE
jgi:2,3-bisphosphoglycerate-independent phosphoglycerate mutase